MVVVMLLSCMVFNNSFTTICYADTIETSDTLENIDANDYVDISNDTLEFRVNKSNGKFILFDKRSNKIWYSNPNDTENDKISAGMRRYPGLHADWRYFCTGSSAVLVYNRIPSCKNCGNSLWRHNRISRTGHRYISAD